MKEFEIIKKAIKNAGKKIFLKGSKEINLKGEYDYFTNTDLNCEKYLISKIKKYFPEDEILSEETCNTTKLQNRVWIIDPVDGTHNYANGLKECGIQIAFFDKNEVKFSVIYLPYYNELYSCVKGDGVRLNGREIKIMRDIPLGRSLIEMCTLTHEEKVKKISLNCLNEIHKKILEVRIVGCGCCEFINMINKNFGAYVLIRQEICKWDLLPGLFMCQESNLSTSNKIYKGFEYCIVANNKTILNYIERKVRKCILEVN